MFKEQQNVSEYTIEIKRNGKVIYPKEISLGFHDFEVLWTEHKQESVRWASYESADFFATSYENANVIKIEGKNK